MGDNRVKCASLAPEDASIPAKLESSIVDVLRPRGAIAVAVEIVAPTPKPGPATHGVPDPWADQVRLASVSHVIAVGAGKGGVGKSTVAVNLALALSREGLRTGLLDADIYGPSLPILLGIEDGAKKVTMSADKHIIPITAHGLPMISFGFFLGEQSPAIWRGPMVSKAVKQFARGVAWPELDVLVVDLPPGTGDVPLSLVQAVSLSGAVVVMQPPRVAAAEARKALEMFRSLDVPVPVLREHDRNLRSRRGNAGSLANECAVSWRNPFRCEIIAEGDTGIPTMIRATAQRDCRGVRSRRARCCCRAGWQYSTAAAAQ